MLVDLFLIVFFAFLGWLKGTEDETNRIRQAFRSEDYDYESFYKVLERYENNNERDRLLLKKLRWKKLKKYFQKKQK